MATINDVAKLAGVSASTVSRTLSGKIHVDNETKQKVQKAVKELNYKPNVLAKSLKEGKTSTIGLIIPNIENPVFPAVARGVEDVARKHGFTVILCNTDENLEIELDYVQKLRKRWIDGLIFATANKNSEHIMEMKEEGFPLVLLLRSIQKDLDAVVIDNFKGAYEAVNYLINKSNKDILIVNGDNNLSLFKERYLGYRKALEDNNITFNKDHVIENIFDEKQAYMEMRKYLENNNAPDAVFATSDPKAIGVIRAIKDYGLKVPEDVSVVGFDNLSIGELIDPTLTTVAQPLYDMGKLAAEKVISLINNKKSLSPLINVVNPKLIVRNSTK